MTALPTTQAHPERERLLAQLAEETAEIKRLDEALSEAHARRKPTVAAAVKVGLTPTVIGRVCDVERQRVYGIVAEHEEALAKAQAPQDAEG